MSGPCRLLPPAAGLLLVACGCASLQRGMLVAVPVADLRGEPKTAALPEAHDDLQESQLVYGESVRVLKIEDGWAQVEAVEQEEYSHQQRWQGYPGWVPLTSLLPSRTVWPRNLVVTAKWARLWKDAFRLEPHPLQLPLGTMVRGEDLGGQVWRVELLDGSMVWMAREDGQLLRDLNSLPADRRRELILRNASSLIGERYYWGGRSPEAVDCSGLVNLAYRAAGVAVPRDAHEQYLRAARVSVLRPADLVFLSERGNPGRIVHVMLYAGGGELIEGPGTGLTVRRIPSRERFGAALEHIRPGALIDGQTVSFGGYLP